ncbi:MAG: MATE family efflux transporter [Geminicoccaceae bacterium]|nr:MATE family efflux transporter [Geminicoccaceae bacterium]
MPDLQQRGGSRRDDSLHPVDGPILALIVHLAVPSAIGMMFQTLFNVVDSFFAGLISTTALAALGASFPVFFLVIALMVGIGQATTSQIANAAGSGQPERAGRFFGQAVILAIAGGMAVGAYGHFGTAALYRLMGVTGESLGFGLAYLQPILYAAPLFLMNAVANAFLTAQGDARSNRNALIVGSLLNVGLNPLFMFGLGPLPGFGILGIALSTILVQALQLAYLMHKVRHSPLATACGLWPEGIDMETMRPLVAHATPTTLQMLTTGIGLFAITYFMGRHGQQAVAAYGVALRIEQLAMLPMVGLTTAAITLVGHNNGAMRFDRVRLVARWLLGTGIALMTAGGVIVFFSRSALMSIFTDDPAVISTGSAYLGVAVLNFNAYCLLIVGASILQGLKRPVFAMVVGIFRHVLGPACVLAVVDPVLGYGLTGIYWGIAAVAWLGATAMLVYVTRRLRELGT